MNSTHNGNIKSYALPYIKALQAIKHNNVNSGTAFTALQQSVEESHKNIVEHYQSKNSGDVKFVQKILGNNLTKKPYNIGLYFEIEFLTLCYRLQFEQLGYKIEKIPERKYKTVDFLIKNALGEGVALVECTTLNLKEKDVYLLNQPLIDVINTSPSFAPDFVVPEAFLTILLGFKELKRTINDKIHQFKEYLEKTPSLSYLRKVIIIDISCSVFDERIFSCNLIEHAVSKWKDYFSQGKDSEAQRRVHNIIVKLGDALKTLDITVLFSVRGLGDLLIEPLGCLIAVNSAGIFPFIKDDFTNFYKVSAQTIYDFNFIEYV